MDNNTKEFIRHVKHECRRYKMKFTKVKKNYLSIDGNMVGGYFSSNPLEIAVAIGTSPDRFNWLDILVHEFSHFEQWRDNDKTYIGTDYKKTTADNIVWNWIAGKDYDENTVETCINKMKLCELNCERRTVKNIIKYSLPIDIEDYIQKANAYIHEYNYIKLTRRWNNPTKKSATDIPEIINAMPKHLNGNYSTMSKKIIALYDKHLGYVDA